MQVVRGICRAIVWSASLLVQAGYAEELRPIRHDRPGATADLGVGLWAWPLPMDFDGDGDLDLVVNCPDKPYNGVYFFENPSGGRDPFPTFKAAKRIGKGLHNVSASRVDGTVRVLSPGLEHSEFLSRGLDTAIKLPLPANVHPNRVRHNQWKYFDHDADGRLDLIVAAEDWTDYGWDDGYDSAGNWKRGPLRGFVYLVRNTGTNDSPAYDKPIKIEAEGKPVEVFGLPSPNFVDFDKDGDHDLLCGEFLDGFTYFENVGDRRAPRYSKGRRLSIDGKPLTMDLEMIVVDALDWDSDGDVDLIVGDEDGRVAWLENTGRLDDRLPAFQPPRYFRQEADDVKFGALATPCGFDWDGDGDEDVISGSTAGHLGFIENLSGPGVERPRWAEPVKLEAEGRVIRIQAGPNGSIQGPAEAKWGYTSPSVADWDHDGLPDIVINSIWGKIRWFKNVGTRRSPKLAADRPVEVDWPGAPPKPSWTWWEPRGRELVTQWRTTPVVVDWNRDGLNDLVMLDHEGYLCVFERRRERTGLALLPPRRSFIDREGKPIRLNAKSNGGSGRRKLCVVDWDGDGRLDVLCDGENARLLRQVEVRDGRSVLEDLGLLDSRNVSGHTTSPTAVDWNRDGVPDLLVGSEDGRFYYKRNPRSIR